jgi:ABC-type transport system involved in multi-copper enzyme maturation permease subunit
MRLGWIRLDWPLLGKELLEQAARKQMYVLRVSYALLLFGGFCFYYAGHLMETPIQVLGRGLGAFNFLVKAQLVAIYLFLPPLMATAVAQEKERDTLGLLFLTELTPWALILQKYVGRLIPMLTFLLLSLPLMAVSYSLGGVPFILLCGSACRLLFTCLVVGALALECSVHEATTFQALTRCWVYLALFSLFCTAPSFPFWEIMQVAAIPRSYRGSYLAVILPITVVLVGFNLLPTLLFLLRAKQNLVARAYAERRNPFGYQFKQFDQYWQDLRKLVRGILKTRDQEAHALAEQVIRRQLSGAADRRTWSLGGFLFARMQVPGLLAWSIIVGSIVFVFVLVNGILMDAESTPIPIVITGIWGLALVTIPIQGANVIARERMNERLDVVLTTPLTGSEILNQWLAPVQRWIRFLARPLLILFLVEAWVKHRPHELGDPRWKEPAIYLGISLLTVWIYPLLVQWSSLWIGLHVRNQMRALLASLLMAVAWCVVPLQGCDYLHETGLLSARWAEQLRFVSPVNVIRVVETFGSSSSGPGIPVGVAILVAVHFALAGLLLWWTRHACLQNADRCLGRV